jgi:hypothetical protein
MRKRFAAALSAGALVLVTAAPAAAAPNERACANGHGTHVAHETVPHDNHQAHMSIPHFCEE